jgi:hypothetical protein
MEIMAECVDTKKMALWQLDGCRCVVCDEPMKAFNERTYWCGICGTIGYRYQIGHTPPYIRFEAPQVTTIQEA